MGKIPKNETRYLNSATTDLEKLKTRECCVQYKCEWRVARRKKGGNGKFMPITLSKPKANTQL
jgi:hypothetical protein